MQAFLVTLSAVALAEMGDRTQLLALVLAARYRKPWPIIAGILVATLFNHFVAGGVGILVADWLTRASSMPLWRSACSPWRAGR
jgi:putative Ca2+/H+ antiporter (TMEM165/GDT1 family)